MTNLRNETTIWKSFQRYLNGEIDSFDLDSEDEELYLTQEESEELRKKRELILQRMIPPKRNRTTRLRRQKDKKEFMPCPNFDILSDWDDNVYIQIIFWWPKIAFIFSYLQMLLLNIPYTLIHIFEILIYCYLPILLSFYIVHYLSIIVKYLYSIIVLLLIHCTQYILRNIVFMLFAMTCCNCEWIQYIKKIYGEIWKIHNVWPSTK